MPVAVYGIGARATYIEFPGHLGQVTAPALFIVGPDGPAPASFRALGPYYAIDRVFAVAELRQGSTTVRIIRRAA